MHGVWGPARATRCSRTLLRSLTTRKGTRARRSTHDRTSLVGMSYAEAFAEYDNSFGYDACAWGDDPFAPSVFGNDPASWGATSMDQVVAQLAGGVGGLGRAVIEDPYVRTYLDSFKEDCKTKAKSGVGEWMRENWPGLALGGALLIFSNWVMLSLGVIPVVKKLVTRRTR